MSNSERGELSNAFRRAAGAVLLSIQDRFRFTLVVSFIGLSLAGLAVMFSISDYHVQNIQREAANLAVTRWSSGLRPGLDPLSQIQLNTTNEAAPEILIPNRIVPRSLLPDHLGRKSISIEFRTNEEVLWVITQHPLIDTNSALILDERDYPELTIAREAVSPQRWLVSALLIVLFFACAIIYRFVKKNVIKPLNLLREALLNRRLSAAARVKQLHNTKITIERLEEDSRFPLEQFEGDEFGQIALILEDEDRKRKSQRDNWLKSFNTINEPIAVFNQSARLKHINESMEQFLDEIGLTSEMVSNLPANNFLSSYLQLDEDVASRLCRVLSQKLPKVHAMPCTVEFPEGNRNFRYSISTIINNGERFAVFCLIRDQLLSSNQNIDDIILEQANSQLKIIHRLQQAARELSNHKSDTILHMCDALIDNIHSLLEISNSSNPSLASHKVEFNILQFFREIQESSEGAMSVSVEIEKSLPTFVVGDPTHLRQFLKGIFQSCHETNALQSVILNVSYNTIEKKLILSIISRDGSPVLRDPSLHLYLSHYTPFLSLASVAEENLQEDEFIRVQVAASAGINRMESLELDLSNRQLPQSLIVVSDDLLPSDARNILESSPHIKTEWLTPPEAIEKRFSTDHECLLLFINNTQKLKDKQIQKVINHARSSGVPSVLLSQQPRRGESLTALRLGFVSYLTLPFESEELHKLLILTMNKTVRSSIGKLGLITKHTVRDLVPSLGKVLLGNISTSHQKESLILANTLTQLGFKVLETTTVHSFFEHLHKGNFEYIACPDGLSTGLKRRIQVSSRDIPCVVFGVQADESARSDEHRANGSSQMLNCVKIADASNQDIVTAALRAAQEIERFVAEANADSEDIDEGEVNLAI